MLELLRVLQLGDSMLPVGSFSFSNGLESAIQSGLVHNLTTLESFVRTALASAATSDGVGLLHAHRAALAGEWQRILEIDRSIFNRKLNEEMRVMTIRMGLKLAELAEHLEKDSQVSNWRAAIKRSETPGTYPVAQALVFAAHQLSEQQAFAVQQYGLATMMLGAALRLMKIHHLEAQDLLFRFNQTAESAYQEIVGTALEDMAAFAPQWDILASVHVKSHVRMFMN